jgi:hypothetical protein
VPNTPPCHTRDQMPYAEPVTPSCSPRPSTLAFPCPPATRAAAYQTPIPGPTAASPSPFPACHTIRRSGTNKTVEFPLAPGSEDGKAVAGDVTTGTASPDAVLGATDRGALREMEDTSRSRARMGTEDGRMVPEDYHKKLQRTGSSEQMKGLTRAPSGRRRRVGVRGVVRVVTWWC